ncbi:MAG TPA: 7-cyano-7-deazaguanine synthase, partial [Acidobacteriota bacterium]|nr:7-cyano-7-deazaguanine synthase [Acidobacteriota bacterium]
MKRAVALASGGLDSSTALALAKNEGFDIYALSFDYGQRHRCELEAAARVAQSLGIQHHMIAKMDLRIFGGSALTADIDVPKDRDSRTISSEIPITYVPARNTIFLSFALG